MMVALNWFYWQKVREHFLYGNVTPAVIVSLDPMMYATLTDVTHGVGDYPVIKIITKKFSSILGKQPAVGAMFPTVSVYQQSMDESLPHWEDFDPRPVEFVTSDQKAIQRVLGQLSKEDWRELKVMLKKVPRPFQPGLYHVGD